MASSVHLLLGNKKPVLYSDLFKTHGTTTSCHSSSSLSSGFTSPDFASSESEDTGGDFIAELTRQMAECMLQEDDDLQKNISKNCDCEVKEAAAPVAAKQGPVWRRRRKNASKSNRSQKLQKANRNYVYTPIVPNTSCAGSGMQAVFLPESGYGSAGTGVFLPRTPGDLPALAASNKKKSGCSMVLVPTRVLQVLDLHFSRLHQDERWSSMNDDNGHKDRHHPVQLENQNYEEDDDEMQLPQEWSY